MASKANSNHHLHFVLIPLMTPGHTIPMIDMAKLLAERGLTVSLLTTPQNAARYRSILRRAAESRGLPIHLVEIPFACRDMGLPAGCESLDIVASPKELPKFFNAVARMQDPIEAYLSSQNNPPPSCIISDKYLAWTSDTARKFRIPRIVFHGISCFSLLSSHSIRVHGAHNSAIPGDKPFLIPGLPAGQKIGITKAQLPGEFSADRQSLDDTYRSPIRDAESDAFGVVINSTDELEHCYVEAYRKAINNERVWCLGPVAQCNKQDVDKFERGHNKASIDETRCLSWLNSKKPRSVIYACLGSLCRLMPAQLIELGTGLEASGRPFVWVVKTGEKHASEMEEWLVEQRFEERVGERGLVIKGWAPQVLILSHPAIGGFLTHCGWNSTIEAISNSVPMITWPLFAEQFLNQRLVVEVLQIAVAVEGAEIAVRWGQEERVGVLVRRDGVVRAVKRLMDLGEEGEKRRKRARKFGELSRNSMEESGSSYLGLTLLIKDILEWTAKNKDFVSEG